MFLLLARCKWFGGLGAVNFLRLARRDPVTLRIVINGAAAKYNGCSQQTQ